VAATWDAYSTARETWNAAYADVFLRGHVLAVVLYAAPRDDAAANAIVTYVGWQDARIAAADLP
jgi:hypothetical protein